MRENQRRTWSAWSRRAVLALSLAACSQQDPTSGAPHAGSPSPSGGGNGARAGAGGGSSGSNAVAAGGSNANANAGNSGATARAGTGAGASASASASGAGGAIGVAGTTADAGGASGGERDYYPMSDGATWTYRHAGGSTTWDEIVEQSAMAYMGKPGVLLKDNPGPSGSHSETILVSDGPKILRVFRKEFTGATLDLSAVYDPGFLRYNRDWEKQQAGYAEVAMYKRTETDGAGQVAGESDRTHRFTVEALADMVTVPAGTFKDCLRVRRSRVRAAGSPMMEGDEDLFWFCPGIGKVREEDQTTGQTEELVSCDVPGGACP